MSTISSRGRVPATVAVTACRLYAETRGTCAASSSLCPHSAGRTPILLMNVFSLVTVINPLVCGVLDVLATILLRVDAASPHPGPAGRLLSGNLVCMNIHESITRHFAPVSQTDRLFHVALQVEGERPTQELKHSTGWASCLPTRPEVIAAGNCEEG
jgi:hypothetical protein